MDNHLVLSSSYFNITGGRRQDSADTFRVLASLRTHSGEEAALYAVSEASTPGPMGARARRLVIDIIQGEYASHFDLGPAARLKAAVEAAHQELANEFKGHVRVGLTALVAEGHSLYLLQVPPAQAYVRHEGDLHAVDSKAPNAATPFAHALGASGSPTISMFRDTMEPSDVVVLCSSWFAHELEPDELRAAFSADGPDGITSTLFERARELHAREVTCIALEAISEEAAVVQPPVRFAGAGAPTIWDLLDEAVSSLSYVWRRVTDEVRPQSLRARRRTAPRPIETATSLERTEEAEPPPIPPTVDIPSLESETVTIEDEAAASPRAGSEPEQATGLKSEGTEELPVLEDQVPDWEETRTEESPAAEADALDLTARGDPWTPSVDAAPESEPSSQKGRDAEIEEVNSFIQNTINLGKVTPPIQGFPDMNVAPERIYPGSGGQAPRRPRRLGDVIRPARRQREAGARAPVLQPRVAGIRRSRPQLGLPSVPPAMWVWSGIGIALLVAIIVAVLLLSSPGGPSHGNASSTYYVDRAGLHASRAEHSTTAAVQAKQLGLAWTDVHRARTHGYPLRQVRAAQGVVQAAANRIHHVSPLTGAVVVARFGNRGTFGASQLAGGWPLLYVLDSLGNRIFSVDLMHHDQVVRRAKAGDVFTIGNPIIPWNDTRQLTSVGDTMVAMDDKYNLLTYSPGQSQPLIEQLVSPSASSRIVAATTFQGNFDVLDAGVGQFWSYPNYSPNNYGQYASGYLAHPNPRLLSSAASMAIDGNIYVGLKGGRVLKFANNAQVPFNMHVPFPLRHIGQIYTRPGLSSLYILDPSSGRVLKIDKRIGYVSAMTIPSYVRRAGVKQLTVSSSARSIYLLTRASIYRFALPR